MPVFSRVDRGRVLRLLGLELGCELRGVGLGQAGAVGGRGVGRGAEFLGVVVGGLRAMGVGVAGRWGPGAGWSAVAGILGVVLGVELGGDLAGEVEGLGVGLGGVLVLRGAGICGVSCGIVFIEGWSLP